MRAAMSAKRPLSKQVFVLTALQRSEFEIEESWRWPGWPEREE